jgi:hypothetical protein
MRKAPVPQAPAPAWTPFSPDSHPATCKDNTPKQQPYFYGADGELYLPPPAEEKARARAA